MTVPLPASGDGSRRRRREERQRSIRRTLARLAVGAAALAVLAGLVWAVADLVAGGDGGGGDGAATADAGGEEDPGPGLVVLHDGGDVYGVTLFVPASGTIVHVPPATVVEVPSLGLASLDEAFEEGGETLLAQSLENVLGVALADVVSLDPAALGAVVAAVAPLEVDVADAVEQRTPSGRVEVLIPAGARTLEGEDAVLLLAALGEATPLERLVRHQAFWSAYLADEQAPAPLPAAAAMAGDDLQQRVLPVEAVVGAGGDELYRIDEEELPDFVARYLPGAADPDARARVQVLNGVGAPGIAQRVQPLLIEAGARLTLSGNADRFDHEVTQVVYYDDARLDDARAIRDALGVGEVVKSLTGLGVVDVTVVVGADFLATDTGG